MTFIVCIMCIRIPKRTTPETTMRPRFLVQIWHRGILRRSTGRRHGFSLVEVTLAIGIMAFAFVALFGLLPTGLGTFRQAMDTSVGAHIAQRIAGELQETDYFTLLKSCRPDLTVYEDSDGQLGLLPRRFFDDQGNEVAVDGGGTPTAQQRTRILYEVIVRVSRGKSVPLVENGTVKRLGTRNLATLTIQVVNNPAGVTIPMTDRLLVDPAATRLSFQTFPAVIARNTVLP